jgi:AraC family transcriptional activator of pyochelin receptor
MLNTPANLPVLINYETLFDRQVAQAYYGVEPEPNGRYYNDDRGMFVAAPVNGGTFVQDLIQFAPDALALTSGGGPKAVSSVSCHQQIIGDDDWIHFCLRLGAAGYDDIPGYLRIEQPSSVGTITRYPANTHIDRISPPEGEWKMACLWLKPSALIRLLETSDSRTPEALAWLTSEKTETARHLSIPLGPQLHAAVSDILSCRFQGGVRRAFVFSKYLEILSTCYQSALNQDHRPAPRIANRDIMKIHEVAALAKTRIDSLESLASLARSVGINRTKLILGFRSVYGTSVEAYWRDWRMHEAKEMLRRDGLSVSEVAHRVGFSEISSFTRAFTRQFGAPPSERSLS